MKVPLGSHSPCVKFRNSSNGHRRQRRRSPSTPLIQWKFENKQRTSGMSARKLAAGLWQFRWLAQPCAGLVNQVLPFSGTSKEYDPGTKHLHPSPLRPGCHPSHKFQHKHASFLPSSRLAMEGATKWVPQCSTTSPDANCLNSRSMFLEGQLATVSVVSALQAELSQARLQIHGLEDELQSSKKKYEHLLGKLGEERNSWQSKYNKMGAIIDSLKDEVNVVRKSQERISIMNSKLMEEVADAKSSKKHLIKDFEEEKRARELLQEVCTELARKIGEDMTEMEVLKSETFRIREELEEERRMLLLAAVWREERMQKKLADARLALEYKYSQINNLVADLEFFLGSRSENLNELDLRKAELIIQAAESVNCQEMREFEYVPPKSGGIFFILYENGQVEANERKMDPFMIKYSPNGHNNGLEEDASVWESASHIKDHSAIRAKENQLVSRTKMECNEKEIQDSPNTDLCSISGEQPGQKASSVSKIWRSVTSNGELCKITSHKANGRLSYEMASSTGTTSPHRKPVEGHSRHLQQDSVGQLVSSDSQNPHITRGMKGSTEWPRRIRKHSSKAKCMKAMIESQKSQLRNLLK